MGVDSRLTHVLVGEPVPTSPEHALVHGAVGQGGCLIVLGVPFGTGTAHVVPLRAVRIEQGLEGADEASGPVRSAHREEAHATLLQKDMSAASPEQRLMELMRIKITAVPRSDFHLKESS
jgi:hypothetical protein